MRRGIVLIAAGAVAAAAPALRFDTVFAVRGEPAALHYRAAYLSGGGEHALEVWRDGDRRIKRVTDGRVATYAVHPGSDAEFHLTVVDPAKRVVTTIGRTSLYRLGNFTDWFDLGHGLRQPRGGYALAAAAAPMAAPIPIAACRWYDLTAAARTTHVCWSRDLRLPLAIVGSDGRAVWRVTAVDRTVPAAVFTVRDQGYVRVDADRDLDRD